MACGRAVPLGFTSRLALEAGVLGLLVVASFLGLDHPLQNLNEGLYGRIALEMAAGGSWIIPTLDGLPYLEKPPLLYWATAFAFRLFGAGESSARLASVAGMLLCASAAWWFARRQYGARVALLSALMLAAFPIAWVMGRTLLFDALFAGLLAWALVLGFEALHREEGRRWLRASAACLALAVLAKGFVALLFFGAVAAALLATDARPWRPRLRRLADAPAALLFAAIAVPWHVLAAIGEPRFAWFYFVNEHLMRFLGQRVPHDYHTGPWWYYVARLAVQAFPWIALLALAPRVPRDADEAPARFLWAAFLVPLVFFSVSEAKGEYFLMVAMPALAVILARRLVALEGHRRAALLALLLIAFIAGAALVPAASLAPYRVPADGPVLLAAAMAIAVASLALFLARHTAVAAGTLAAASLPLALAFSAFLAANAEWKSAAPLEAALQARGLRTLYLYRDYEKLSALGFYHRLPLRIIESESRDLWYGMRLKPDPLRFVADAPLAGLERGVAVLVLDDRLEDFGRSRVAATLRPEFRMGRVHVFTPAAPRGERPWLASKRH